MKRIVFLLGLIVLVVLGLMFGTASGSGAPTSVVGSGDFLPSDGVPRHFTVNAISGPEGVSGQTTTRVGTAPDATTIISEVTCLYVQGNRAVVGSVITFNSTNPAAVGARVIHAFVDNGAPGGPTPDQRNLQVNADSPPTQSDCENAFTTAFTTLFPIDLGNVTVNSVRPRVGLFLFPR